jgi:hypothetical protein
MQRDKIRKEIVGYHKNGGVARPQKGDYLDTLSALQYYPL